LCHQFSPSFLGNKLLTNPVHHALIIKTTKSYYNKKFISAQEGGQDMAVKRIFHNPSFIILFFLLFLISFLAKASNLPNSSSNFSPYWHQRASLFRLLPDTPGEIIFLGDSLTDGCDWAEIFQDWRIKNRGISGDTTAGVIARLDEVVSSKPAKIFLMVGVNDLAQGKNPADIINNIKLIVKKIKISSPQTKIYLQSLLPVNPSFPIFPDHVNKASQIKQINQVLQRDAPRLKAAFINLYDSFATSEGYLKSELTNDGLHLTGKGYLLWKSLIEVYLKTSP